MRRRKFLTRSTVALAGLGALAGCSGDGGSPPPRKSEVFGEISASNDSLEVPLVGNPTVESRADVSAREGGLAPGGVADPGDGTFGDFSPVGRASAGGRGGRGGRGSGATGRGSGGYRSAPRGRHGRAVYHGHDDDDDWREENRNEIQTYPAVHQAVGIAFLGTAAQYSDDPPGPGPVDWDETWSDPGGQEVTYGDVRPGWYRVGSHLTAENGTHDFGWEAVDFQVEDDGGEYDVENPWKVSQRL